MDAPPDNARPLSATDAERALALEVADGRGVIAWDRIDALLATEVSVTTCRHVLNCGAAAVLQRFRTGAPASELLAARTALVDRVLCRAWESQAAPALPGAALAAVGGYGRGELFPHSDVDILVLVARQPNKRGRDAISAFLTLLWDLGLEIGHSVRSVRECRDESRGDISIMTTLMESRLLCGADALFAKMQKACGPDHVWPSRAFFEGKLKEQRERHLRYDDTAYNLEPNVKGSPGGLRDMQMISWVARRHLGSGELERLVDEGFMTDGQLRMIRQGLEFLGRIRFALHALTRRREDRLLFEHQTRIAELFGYEDASYMLAVEQLMQRYYRTVMELGRINEMLLQLFQEAILMNPNAPAKPLNERFEVRNGFLQAARADLFETHPSALLEMFLLLQQHPEVSGVAADTITLVKRNLYLIDDEFRQDPRNHQLFLQILRAPEGVTHELRRMNRYGVLGQYVTAFGRIVGRMQYDLFHAYTVDAHTLFVVSNLRRMALERFDHELPRCSEIMQSLPVPEVAYLAGLFHDIAKGRGGDHSELGAVDAEAFCLEHGMSRYDARLVAWLVRHHLLLSLTAQKRDISDPAVLREFAEVVGDETHLDYLYVLTVADVRATNPKLWNSWKAQLFEELYILAKRLLRRGLANPIDKAELIAERQQATRRLLDLNGAGPGAIEAVWPVFTDDYFLRSRPEEIAWHTRVLAEPGRLTGGIIVEVHTEATGGGTSVMVYNPQEVHTFATVTAVLDELGLNIADARITPLGNDHVISTYVVLEQDGEQITLEKRREQIRARVSASLARDREADLTVSRRAPRQVRMFPTATHVEFSVDEAGGQTVMELTAGDRPGLLCEVGKVLRQKRISITTAKILTVGERAEDVFYITTREGAPLSDAQCREIEAALADALASAA